MKKGEIVCELDSAALKTSAQPEDHDREAPRRPLHNAKLAREAAEIAANEYIERIYRHEQDAVGGEINVTRISHREGQTAAAAIASASSSN